MEAKVWSDKEKKWVKIERDCENQYLHYDIFRCKITRGHCRKLMEIPAYCDMKPIERGLMKFLNPKAKQKS